GALAVPGARRGLPRDRSAWIPRADVAPRSPERRQQMGDTVRSRRRTPGVTTVLFACVHNAGRSQIAAAFFTALADPARARALSAGTAPADCVHPGVVETMNEVGIDLASARPRLLTPDLAAEATVLVTMGCGETCPVVPGAQ